MDIIINAEDQSWRSDQYITPTDNEFKDQEDHTFMVDWIRVFKHENDLILTSLETTTTLQIFPNTSNGNVIIKSYKELKKLTMLNNTSQKIQIIILNNQ